MTLQQHIHSSDRPTPVLASAVHLQLLTGFDFSVDGARVVLPLNSQKLLAYLALHDRPQLRTGVASALWLDLTDQRAAANLRGALWKLHHVRDRVIVGDGAYLSLAPWVEVDFAAVGRWARALIEPSADHDLMPGVDLLSADLLPQWDEEWIVFERERLRQLRIHAMEALSRHLRSAGRHAEAIDAGLSAVSADPLRESAHRTLIEAHLAEGNVADARRQFDHCRRVLWDSLRIQPSADLWRLAGLLPPGG